MTEKLYHYTDFNGLNGILKDKCLWATNAYTTNDHSEINLGLELLKNALVNWTTIESGITLENLNFDLNFFLNSSSDPTMSRGHFLACFSTIPKSFSEKNKKYITDNGLLSQWRSYGLYAIKFEREILENYFRKKCPADHGIWIANLTDNVTYLENNDFNEFNQKPLIKATFETIKRILLSQEWKDIRKKLIKKNELLEQEYFLISGLIQQFLICGFMIKHKGFEEEQEVRVLNVALPKSHDKREIYFHAQNRSHIKLFYEDREIIRTAVKEIIIGPMQHQELAKQQVECMLEEYGFSINRTNKSNKDLVSIKCSQTPFIRR